MASSRVILAASFTIAIGFVIAFLPASLRAPRASHVLPRDSACDERPYTWAAAGEEQPPAVGDGPASRTPAVAGDSVIVRSYSFRPGRPSEIVSSGLLHNRSNSTIEIRGYRVEFLSATGEVVGEGACRVIMGGEQCGVGGSNLERAGDIAVLADTLPGAPESADRDTARIYWSYCRALTASD